MNLIHLKGYKIKKIIKIYYLFDLEKYRDNARGILK